MIDYGKFQRGVGDFTKMLRSLHTNALEDTCVLENRHLTKERGEL